MAETLIENHRYNNTSVITAMRYILLVVLMKEQLCNYSISVLLVGRVRCTLLIIRQAGMLVG